TIARLPGLSRAYGHPCARTGRQRARPACGNAPGAPAWGLLRAAGRSRCGPIRAPAAPGGLGAPKCRQPHCAGPDPETPHTVRTPEGPEALWSQAPASPATHGPGAAPVSKGPPPGFQPGAPYTCSARLTKASTMLLAILSKTGPTRVRSAVLSNP